MDLSNLDTTLANEGAELHLRHPVTDEPLVDDKGKPIALKLLGMDSSRYRKHQRNVLNRRLAGNGKASVTAEQIDEDALQMFVSLTVGWSGNLVLDGGPLAFNEANALKLYTRLPWAREQADRFIGDRANFLKV